MFKKIRDLFHQYREYVRIHLVMSGVLIAMIMIYLVLSVLNEV